VEVYRIQVPAAVLAPLLALALQALLPLYFPSTALLDLPLLVVIYVGVTRRSPVTGLLTGAVLGMAQDGFAHGPIGLFGTAKTVIGYVTSTVSTWFDVERVGIRFLLIFVFYYFHLALLLFVEWGLLREQARLAEREGLLVALVNALTGVVLFKLLDRFREPA